MKHNMNKFIIIASLLLTSLGAWAAQNVTTAVEPSAAAGTLTYNIENGVCTLTATPASGYYLTKDYITAVTSLDGAGVQSRRKAPTNIDVTSETLVVSATSETADPSGVTTYTFDMPEDENINVTVTAVFQTLIAITPTVTLEGWTFGQTANTPVVSNNPSTGQVTFTYAVKDSGEFSETVPTAVGNYTVKAVVAAAREYAAGEATADFTISAKALTAAMIADIAAQTYTGSAIEPVVSVTDGSTPLVLDTDYTVSYSNNVNAGEATVTVTGKGNYDSGTTATKTFTISPVSLEGVTIVAIADQTFTGEAVEPAVSVTFNDKAVSAEEYAVSYSNNTDAGEATVTLTAKGVNFTEGSTKTASFQIVAATATITAVASQETTYNGESQAVTATVDKGTAVITYFTSEANRTSNTEGTTDAPTNAGTYYVKVTQGNANYTSTAVDVTFTINPKALTDDMVTLSAESFPYNGETQKPTVTVSDGTAMTADDYTVTNNGGQAVGTYDVVVTGKGNYTGEVTRSFSIVNRTLEVGANGDVQFAAGQTWASFYTTTESLELPEGVMAYIVTAVSETSATLQAINYVPQNVPVFLENGSTETTDNASADGNLLQGTTAATAVSTISGTVYGLHNNKLMQVTSGSIPAGRAYLTVDVPAGGRELTMIKESDTTGIETLGVADVDSNNLWYDMAGHKLQSKPNKKGFYIQNGKKVFVNK